MPWKYYYGPTTLIFFFYNIDDTNNNLTSEACLGHDSAERGDGKHKLTKDQAMMLFHRLMDAGLLRNGIF